jgi:uncharacterized membrane protein YagU involved in acid resistance
MVMVESASIGVSQSTRAFRAILAAGLLSGALDLTAAFINAGRMGIAPARVLQFIASGLLGTRSFNGGARTAALGAGAHFLIAFGASVVYYAASRQFEFLGEQAVVSGLLYGVAVYLFMNLIVLPLSAAPKRPVSMSSAIVGLVIIMLCVGLPISLVERWASR